MIKAIIAFFILMFLSGCNQSQTYGFLEGVNQGVQQYNANNANNYNSNYELPKRRTYILPNGDVVFCDETGDTTSCY